MQQGDEQEQPPDQVILLAKIGDVGVRGDSDNVDNCQACGAEATGESKRQKRRQQ